MSEEPSLNFNRGAGTKDTPPPEFLLTHTHVQSRPDGPAQGHTSKWLVMWQKVFLTAHMTLHIFMHMVYLCEAGASSLASAQHWQGDTATIDPGGFSSGHLASWLDLRSAGRLTCADSWQPEEEITGIKWISMKKNTHVHLSFHCDRLECWLLLTLGAINLHERHNWNWIQYIWESKEVEIVFLCVELTDMKRTTGGKKINTMHYNHSTVWANYIETARWVMGNDGGQGTRSRKGEKEAREINEV